MSEMDNRTRRVLRQHLTTDKLLGVEAVPMGERRAAPQGAPAQVVAKSTGSAAPVAAGRSVKSAGPPASVPPPALDISSDKALSLRMIDEREVKLCTKCTLCEGRTNTVFGEGDPEAKLMFIGEGPGETEDRLGRPFVGKAGELLDKMIVAMGLRREQVYIGNVVKCRPPNNRTPQPDEAAQCFGYLKRQIRIIQPQVIVTLGLPAARAIIGDVRGITAIRGTWHVYHDPDDANMSIPVMPTFHPAYVLRAYTPDNRKKVWSDLQQAMERLGLK